MVAARGSLVKIRGLDANSKFRDPHISTPHPKLSAWSLVSLHGHRNFFNDAVRSGNCTFDFLSVNLNNSRTVSEILGDNG